MLTPTGLADSGCVVYPGLKFSSKIFNLGYWPADHPYGAKSLIGIIKLRVKGALLHVAIIKT